MRYLVHFLGVFLFGTVSVVATYASDDGAALGSLLSQISKEYAVMSYSQELFKSKEFLRLYEHPEAYMNPGLQLIETGKLSPKEEEIFIYGMQKLPLADYVQFCETALRLWEHHQLSKSKLYLIAFPAYQWNTIFAEQFGDTRVRVFLSQLRSIVEFQDEWKNIDHILSGEASDDVKELRASGQIK